MDHGRGTMFLNIKRSIAKEIDREDRYPYARI